ncbi:DNA-binding transcriptional regulator, CsgD family [Roseovarius lutimaris]|uniref:DNA-binding transcriptional regulator, CsgD family n=2 Tax=Roseovarius lutimaris TaxID=1005928 RepID=A0A1I4ZI94_9RHOB|nr:DNA-binding transcriptional regulator, CsgD family [Roseovarius lutimaris]
MPHRMPKDRSQLVPFEGATDLHLRVARDLDLINNWNAALFGHFSMTDVLAMMIRQVEAYGIALYRFENDCLQTIAAVSRAMDAPRPGSNTGNMLLYVKEHHKEAIQPGATFRLSKLCQDPTFEQSPAQREWAAQPKIVDKTLIILEVKEGRTDVLETTFHSPPNTNADLPCILISTAMANAWEIRTVGLIARQIHSFAQDRSSPSLVQDHDILGPRNPVGLSRAEQRVCHHLAAGDSAKEIADALNVTVATIRTHLRNVYFKTGAHGQVKLITLINEGKGFSQ